VHPTGLTIAKDLLYFLQNKPLSFVSGLIWNSSFLRIYGDILIFN
jgi:hypothetical protein